MKLMTKCVAGLVLGSAAMMATADPMVFKSLDDLDRCAAENQYDTSYCLPALEAFAKKNPRKNFEIGQRARLQFASWVALRFFEPGLGVKPTPAQCADPQLSIAVLSGLALPPDYPGFISAKKIFTGACFDGLKAGAEKEINESNGAGYMFTNMCPIFAERKMALAACAPKAPEVVAPVVEEVLPKIDVAAAAKGLVKVYSGPEGEKVTISELAKHPGYVVIRFDGIRGAHDGKTLLHREVIQGDRVEFWTEIDGKRWTSINGRKQSGYSDYEARMPGQTDFAISYSEAASKAAAAK